MAEGVPTYNQRGQRSGPCRLLGGLDKARHIVPTAFLVRVQLQCRAFNTKTIYWCIIVKHCNAWSNNVSDFTWPSGTLSPIVGLVCAPIFEIRFIDLAMSLLDFSPRIPLGTFSILLIHINNDIIYQLMFTIEKVPWRSQSECQSSKRGTVGSSPTVGKKSSFWNYIFLECLKAWLSDYEWNQAWHNLANTLFWLGNVYVY